MLVTLVAIAVVASDAVSATAAWTVVAAIVPVGVNGTAAALRPEMSAVVNASTSMVIVLAASLTVMSMLFPGTRAAPTASSASSVVIPPAAFSQATA